MSVSTPTRACSCSAPAQAQLDLQASLIEAMGGLVDLVARLSQQLVAGTTDAKPAPCHAEPWCELMEPTAPSRAGHNSSSPLWDELSVVELRSLLRSYPIDRTSLPAPIELLRRSELIEVLNQIQALAT
jgi:hypothetical protein